ncbi:hypothetical protein AB0L99_42720 [Streptomyces sp. NPDC051954]|uniref:hypothetical protein n=1 Tax=Streptomyces sp. NPDC051954 TaxID=3155524 RepID=UPI003434C9E1
MSEGRSADVSRTGSRQVVEGLVRSPVVVLVDAEDHPAWIQASLGAHRPGVGRVVVHPTAGASHPAGLAQDVLGTLGKRLPQRRPEVPRHKAGWADMVRPAWRAAACWINAHRIGHLIVVRAQTLTPARWAQLADLQRRTGVFLSLVWHGEAGQPLDKHARALRASYAVVDEQEVAWRRLGHSGQRSRAGIGARGENATSNAAVSRVQRVGHPLHAGLLAAQLACQVDDPCRLAGVRLADLAPDGTGLALPHAGAGRWSYARTWQPVPAWAWPLLLAARAWQHQAGHRHDVWRLFQHDNFHHHNQLIDVGAELGIPAAIEHLDGDPAWPKG